MAHLLTIPEVVSLIKVPEATIQRWIRQGEFPCSMRDGIPVIKQATLQSWADSKNIFLEENRQQQQQVQWNAQDVVSAIQNGNVYYHLEGDTFHEIFWRISQQISPQNENPSFLASLLLAREELTSTAIGKGIAIPHPRYPISTKVENSRIFLFFADSSFDWKTPDGIPVYALFVLLSANTTCHLKILSQLARVLHLPTTELFLKSYPDRDELLEYFQAKLAQLAA